MRILGAPVLVALLGCGPKGSPPPDPEPASIPDDLVQALEAELVFFEKVAGAAQAGADCDAIAADVDALAAGPDRAVVGTAEKHPDYQTHQAELQARYAGRIDAALTTLLQAVQPCAQHAGVGEALKRLGF